MHSILDFKSISLSALLHIPFSSINGAKYFKTWIFYKTKVYQLPSGRRVFSRMQQGGLQYSKVKLVDNDIVFFFVVASLQCFAFKPKIPWTWLERIECRRKTCIMHIANFKSFRCGTQILGRFLMISEFCSLCILKKSHGKSLFSTNQIAENSKNVSLLSETIFEFSEQRDCFQISSHLIGWKQSLSVRLF